MSRGSWTPDEILRHPDGTQEQIRYRRTLGADGARARIRKVFGASGQTHEVWHEVVDSDGHIIHQHLKWKREGDV
jgi:2-polyprenyl-6-methoxyphenol hydroxylase-like FAD-dependent oxidoreductase